jgi:hypothetical protein
MRVSKTKYGAGCRAAPTLERIVMLRPSAPPTLSEETRSVDTFFRFRRDLIPRSAFTTTYIPNAFFIFHASLTESIYTLIFKYPRTTVLK